MNNSDIKSLRIRTGIKAGGTVCFQEVDGNLYPIASPETPPVYPPPSPPTPSNVQWLSCQSCNGTRTSQNQLQNARCEVCNY